jgi:hypothetical protein
MNVIISSNYENERLAVFVPKVLVFVPSADCTLTYPLFISNLARHINHKHLIYSATTDSAF